MAAGSSASSDPKSCPPTIGEVAAIVAEALEHGDVLLAVENESRAQAIARTLRSMCDGDIILCPPSDALPGDKSPASPANVGQRVAALRHLRNSLKQPVRAAIALVTTGEALAHRYAPPEAYDPTPPTLSVGQAIDLTATFEQLLEMGYIHDERVDEPGEVALRGQVLDVYPADADAPLRVEIKDGHICAIRAFSVADQLTTDDFQERELGRVNEPDVDGKSVGLLSHLPAALLALDHGADSRRKKLLALASDIAARQPKRAAKAIFAEQDWANARQNHQDLTLTSRGEAPPRFVETKSPMRAFLAFARAHLASGGNIAIAGGARDLRFLRPRLATALDRPILETRTWRDIVEAPPGTLLFLEAPVDRGFGVDRSIVVAAADLLGSRAERPDAAGAAMDLSAFGLSELRVGDVIVHEDHGIGVIAGLERLPGASDEDGSDAFVLTYADNGSRMVPVSEAGQIWRYGSDADAVTLDKLDGSSWIKRREAVDVAVAETARAMTEMAEQRASLSAPALEPDIALYERFAAGFPFDETPDQLRAIAAVRDDLASGRPMDRLVIGDVGYGKTEVALRAAAIATFAGYQVAIAAPTTVLARQHLETFRTRFEGTAITVCGLSRLSTAAEKKQVKAGLADGSIDIVVGTGAVASKTVRFKTLALVVVDEEQRFGAADKSRLRALGAGHTLSLSATPIPRTLQSALVGLQQLSVLASPPARRQPIRTAVGAFDKDMLRAALLREHSRGGQSFVVVPRIEDMAAVDAMLGSIVPELDRLQAHGKLPAAEIDEVMVRFGAGDGDILVATNIIEAGLDVPRANTMAILRADLFGLSQLHQLRGRVGRGSRRGQVLLFTDADHEIAPRTLKRLRTLEAFDQLGAGFMISARDLDMRGAGDLVGEAQAGHMKLIGVDLYQHLLQAALREARGDHVDLWRPELELGVTGRLPESFIPDVEQRMTLYARVARASDGGALDMLEAELEDRFGTLPAEAATLLAVARVGQLAAAAGVARVVAGPAAIALTPQASFFGPVDGSGLVAKGDRFILQETISDPSARLQRLTALLEVLNEGA